MSHVVRCWLEAHPEGRAVAVDLNPPDAVVAAFLQPVLERLEVRVGDVRDAALWDGIAGDVSVSHLVHGAAVTSINRMTLQEDGSADLAGALPALDVNIMGTLRMLAWAARQPKLARCVTVSSGSVYPSEGPSPLPEDTAVEPDGLYGISKYVGELYTAQAARQFDLPALAVRLSGVYGPLDRDTSVRSVRSVPGTLLRAALAGEELRLSGLEARGDYIQAGDVGRAVAALLDCASPSRRACGSWPTWSPAWCRARPGARPDRRRRTSRSRLTRRAGAGAPTTFPGSRTRAAGGPGPSKRRWRSTATGCEPIPIERRIENEGNPMTQACPATVGQSLDEIETPALVVDLDAYERNLARMATALEGSSVQLRPHAKTHKSPEIALDQMRSGQQSGRGGRQDRALGGAGGPSPSCRLRRRRAQCRGPERGRGCGRCDPRGSGRDRSRLRPLRGRAWRAGPCARHPGGGEPGLPCPVVSGGGTGTLPFDLEAGVLTELQAGSYIFLDADYARNETAESLAGGAFEHSLFVLATVMSLPRPGRAVTDAGLKALAFDSGPPDVWRREGVRYVGPSDEHGTLEVSGDAALGYGEKVLLVPGHCDPTVNLYDWYVGVRDGQVEKVWPVAARGAVS
jgi:nucleoside-diphosphate-sugar epimerase